MVLGGDTGRVPSDVTLDNWQSATQLHWTFQHVADFLPTATISRGNGPVAELPSTPVDLTDIPLYDRTNRRRTTVGDVMAATATDGWIVLQHGKVLGEYYYGGMEADSSHLLMSVSKSLIGMVAGALVSEHGLDVDAELPTYVPALAHSGYAGATVRHLLDMRSGIAFSEDYLDPMAEVRLLEQAIGWAPRTVPAPADHHVRLPADPEAEVPAWRAIPVPVLRDRRPRLDLRGGQRSADARADVRSCCGQARRAERRDDRCRLGRHRNVRRRHQRLPVATWPDSVRCSSTAGRR